jgi:hypothetical protein
MNFSLFCWRRKKKTSRRCVAISLAATILFFVATSQLCVSCARRRLQPHVCTTHGWLHFIFSVGIFVSALLVN